MIDSPYAKDLGDRDPLASLADTPEQIRAVIARLGPEGHDRPYAPGKWTARQVLVHLAQFEIVSAYRIRMALAAPGHAAHNYDQDAWQAFDDRATAIDAFEVYAAVRRMTLAMARNLPAASLDRQLTHAMFGAVSVRWLLAQIAGHELRHLNQLRAIARA